jgi:hypothetical protein
MARKRFNRRVLIAAIETTYATDASPTGTLNAVLTRNLEIDPIEGEELQRELDKGTFGADAGSLVGQFARIRCQVEFAGAGAAGDLPAWDPLMRAAGHAQDSDDPGGTPSEIYYDPIDTDVDSVTLYFQGDDVRHRVVGARGSVSFEFGKRQYGYMQFDFLGLIEDIADNAMPTVDTSAFVKPVPFRAANVDFSLFGAIRPLHSLTINGGQQVDFYETSVDEALEQQDRQSDFQATIEQASISDWDWASAVRDGTVGALQYVHGTTAGNIVQIDAGEVQILRPPRRSSENGIVALQLGGSIIASSTSAQPTGYRITVK